MNNSEIRKIEAFSANPDYENFKKLSENTIYIFKVLSNLAIDYRKGDIELSQKVLQYISRIEDIKLNKKSINALLSEKKEYINWIEDKNFENFWRWREFSKDPSLTIDRVLIYRNKPLQWDIISAHKNITIRDIEDNMDLPWNWESISSNPNIDMEFVKRHFRRQRFDWKALSSNAAITMEDIKNNPDFNWKPEYVYKNPNLDYETAVRFKKYQYLGYKKTEIVLKNQKDYLKSIIKDIEKRRKVVNSIYDKDSASILKLYIGYK